MKKKTCLGCKAIDESPNNPCPTCILKFNVKYKKIALYNGVSTITPYPISYCPKPKTNEEFFKQLKIHKING